MLVPGSDHLKCPAAQQKVLIHVLVGHFRTLPEDVIESQLDKHLKLDLEKFLDLAGGNFPKRFGCAFTFEVNGHELYKA